MSKSHFHFQWRDSVTAASIYELNTHLGQPIMHRFIFFSHSTWRDNTVSLNTARAVRNAVLRTTTQVKAKP